MTTIGFFSVVRKPGEQELTVRARVRSDLEALADEYLPTLGDIVEGAGTDYPFRARVSSDALAAAVARMVEDVTYPNFKNEVASRQGGSRAQTYGEVWRVLHHLSE